MKKKWWFASRPFSFSIKDFSCTFTSAIISIWVEYSTSTFKTSIWICVWGKESFLTFTVELIGVFVESWEGFQKVAHVRALIGHYFKPQPEYRVFCACTNTKFVQISTNTRAHDTSFISESHVSFNALTFLIFIKNRKCSARAFATGQMSTNTLAVGEINWISCIVDHCFDCFKGHTIP